MLESQGVEVVAEVADGGDAIERARELHPDVVVMDVTIVGMNGIEATRRLTLELPQVRVVGLSVNTDRRYVDAMFAAGAAAYLPKSSGLDELMLALRTVTAGGKYCSPSMARACVASMGHMAVALSEVAAAGKPLSPREREVLQLIATGKSSKEIAARLDIGVATVETHRRQLMDKLGIRTIAELTKYAVKAGLTSLD